MATVDLRKLASLRDYTNSELRLLASVAPAREFTPGQSLCKEGTSGQSCFLLAIGEVQVNRVFEDGERVLATLKAGQIVGQMALVDRSPRSASVVSSGEVIALELTRDVFERLLKASSPLALRFQEQIAIAGIRQLRMATQRLGTLLIEQGKTVAKAPPRSTLQHMQAALEEWDMSMDDLDAVKVSVPAGMMGADELKSRRGPL
ncbi:MAG: cyclic nucleotide-binding domain-containing protein [Deltaproteobacteria bacterium]|nr:cyclic nucleotide-binding domain-containing protein [Deltaproteobacteria bacterium]